MQNNAAQSWLADPDGMAWAAPQSTENVERSPQAPEHEPVVPPAAKPRPEEAPSVPRPPDGSGPRSAGETAAARLPTPPVSPAPPISPAPPVSPAAPATGPDPLVGAPRAGGGEFAVAEEERPDWGEHSPLANAVRERRTPPREGWRSLVYRATGGRWNPGLSEAEERLRGQMQRIRTPLSGPHSVVVGSIKGGIGKTTVSSLLGLALAEHRGDRVIAIDANPDAGTLGDRLVGEENASRFTVRDLLDDIERIRSSTQLSGYTHLAGRLQVLTSEQEPELSEMFSAGDYQAVLALLARFFEAIITDSGTGVVHSAMQGSLEHADSLVIVGAPTQDGASRASRTLHWLAAHGYRDLAEDAVVVLSCDRHSPFVDESLIRQHFRSRCRAVVELPPDPHLATGGIIDLDGLTAPARDAALELGATVAEGFHAPRSRGLATHGFRAAGSA